MANFVFLALFLLAGIAASAAAPAEGAELHEHEHLRYRRVTCDLLSFGGHVGDAACAANCLSLGKAGGHCNHDICECRKETLKELWDKRFG